MSAKRCSRPGARLRVAERDPRRAWFLQPLGVGRPGRRRSPPTSTSPARVDRAVEGADAVINLVGMFKGNLDAIHVDGAGKLAAAAKTAGRQGVRPRQRDRRRSRQRSPTMAGPRARASRRSAPPSRARRSSARAWCSGPRTSSPTASPRMARLPLAAGDRAADPLPAGLCPRPGPGDRRGGARSQDAWRQDL